MSAPDLRLPRRPAGRLDEFASRYAAAERIAGRYAAVVTALAGHRVERGGLTAAWPTILELLYKIGEWSARGVRAGRKKGRSRQQHLHEVHRLLVALERAVDGAVAMAVTLLLELEGDEPGRRRADLDRWLAELNEILVELDEVIEAS